MRNHQTMMMKKQKLDRCRSYNKKEAYI